MKLEFNWKYKDYELRAVPRGLIRQKEDKENYTIELIKWNTKEDGKKYCFAIAYWIYKEGYELRFIGNRMFECIDDEDIALIWQQLKLAQKVLDKFELEEVFEEFMD